MGLRSWIDRRRRERRARALLDETLREPRRLAGTSLGPRHAARCVVRDVREEGGEIVALTFGIVRHPRPYAFSRQSHKVLEVYAYDVRAGEIRIVSSENLTRSAGRDDD